MKKRKRKVLNKSAVTKQVHLTSSARILYKRALQLTRQMSVLKSRNKQYKKRLQLAIKARNSLPIEKILGQLNTPTYNFLLSQIKNQNKSKNGRRFSTDAKILALSMMKSSGKGYKFLSKIFSLPSRKTLTTLLRKFPLTEGLNEHLLKHLEGSIRKMNKQQRCCIVMFDEMSLSTELHYDPKEDRICGLTQNFGIVDHANVFMVQGIYTKWKQPLCFTFSDGPIKTFELKNMIVDIIKNCQKIGLHVIATVCDQGGSNQAAIHSLLKDTQEKFSRQNKENRLFGFEIMGQEIVPLFDVPHIFKGIRNNLLEKELHFEYQSRKMIAKWEHINSLYVLDAGADEQICTKLTDSHVKIGKLNKMKVSLCTQVFSHQVGSLLKGIARWGKWFKIYLISFYFEGYCASRKNTLLL